MGRLVAPCYMDGQFEQSVIPGVELNLFQDYADLTLTDGGPSYWTAEAMAKGDLKIAAASFGAEALTLPTADAIIKAFIGNSGLTENTFMGSAVSGITLQRPINLGFLPPGSSFRRRIINNNDNTVTPTIVASGGLTLVGTTTIITVNWREYLFRIYNSSPATSAYVGSTNASKAVTCADLEQVKYITPGMAAFGTNAGAAAVVDSVNYDTGAIHVTVNSTGTASQVWTFTPRIVMESVGISGTI